MNNYGIYQGGQLMVSCATPEEAYEGAKMAYEETGVFHEAKEIIPDGVIRIDHLDNKHMTIPEHVSAIKNSVMDSMSGMQCGVYRRVELDIDDLWALMNSVTKLDVMKRASNMVATSIEVVPGALTDGEAVYEHFWKALVEKEDGSLNVDQVKKELADYKIMLDEVPKVYNELAGLSKPLTRAEAIISIVEDRMIDRQMAYDDLINMDSLDEPTLREYLLKE